MSGNHLPNALPPRVRRHSFTAQTRAKRVRRFTEHARDRPVWQCRLRGTPTSQARTTASAERAWPGPSARAQAPAPLPRGPRAVPYRHRPGGRPIRPGGAPPARTAPVPPIHPEPAGQPTTDAVRRAASGYPLIPVALLAHGVPAGRRRDRRARPPSTVTCRVLPRRSARTAAREAPRSARFPTSRPAEGAHRSDRPSWSCAGRTTGFRTRDRMFSANFRVESIPCRIGRSTPLPAGRKRPSGTLPPHGDGP